MLMIDGIIFSLQRHGGISVYFKELIHRLAYKNHEYCTMVYLGTSDNDISLPNPLILRNLRIAERYRRCPVAKNVSLFHSSYYRLPDRSLPTVTTVHDFVYERFASRLRGWVHSKQKFMAIRESQAIICISQNTRRDLLHFLPEIDPNRVYVIYNGVGESFFPLKLECKSSSDRPYVLFVGGRSGYKHFETLVCALSLVPDLRLLCVGGGPLTYKERVIINLKLPNRFEHRISVSEEVLNTYYNKAFCLAYPSAYEGFGIPVLEAMRAGCPVIAVNSSSIPEVAGNAALLVDQPGVEELVCALKQLQDEELRIVLRQSGFIQARQFSWQRMFEETLRVYENVCGDRKKNEI